MSNDPFGYVMNGIQENVRKREPADKWVERALAELPGGTEDSVQVSGSHVRLAQDGFATCAVKVTLQLSKLKKLKRADIRYDRSTDMITIREWSDESAAEDLESFLAHCSFDDPLELVKRAGGPKAVADMVLAAARKNEAER